MLFPFDASQPLTPTSLKAQCDALKQFELAHFNGFPIDDFIANRSQFYDALLTTLWGRCVLEKFSQNPPRFTLIAVGGYGREEMFPLSDLDILILSENPIDEQSREILSQFVQLLWDSGFSVGHSVRTLAECESEGRADITVATNLLEGRYLCGDENLFQKLIQILQQPDFWAMPAFFKAKRQEQQERYRRYNNTSYNLEPDIKYSPGGLRDLHLLYWIALRQVGAKNLIQGLQAGFINEHEYQRLRTSQQFLFKIRFALHLILKRYDNRLLFDRQLKISELLGYQGEGNQPVETMMREFFQALHTISLLSELLLKHYDEQFLTSSIQHASEQLDENFVLLDNHIFLQKTECFRYQPESILDLFFHLTQFPQAQIHSSVLRELYATLEQCYGKHKQKFLCELPRARKKFLALFSQPKAIERAFIPMHRYGVLTAYLPQWSAIVGLMQFDLFHLYTVDEHILRVMLKLEDFLSDKSIIEHPICHQIFPKTDRTLLYIAALFHDIAKGRGGDHARLGVQDVRDFALLHGLTSTQTETLEWLVAQHLLMSVTAQRRDIHDPEVLRTFATQVKTQTHLEQLLCLTVADICATNNNLWNSWKRSLFSTLYHLTCDQLTHGMQSQRDLPGKALQQRKQAMTLLQTQLGDKISAKTTALDAFWARCPEEYFLRNTPSQLAWHSQLLLDFEGDLLVSVHSQPSLGGTEVFVYCPDQSRLFNKIATVIGAKKISIHDAQILTTKDGYVLDSFIVTEFNGDLLAEERCHQLQQALQNALQSPTEPKAIPYTKHQLQHFRVKTEIRFLHSERCDQTELEIFALDKPGLLAEISQIFCDFGLDLRHAKISTVGEKAEDFFILQNKQKKSLSLEIRQALEARLLEALG